ncbi:MAG: CxxxxCH/CxxCH domain-containing protein [Anaeromyxobacter sp.]
MKLTTLALAAALLAALATGCDGIARPIAEGEIGRTKCTACHGDATRDEPAEKDKAAPPQTPGGVGEAGAHLAHLHGGQFRGRIACSECHTVPDVTFHTNGKVELTFGAIAGANGVVAAYDPATHTCAVWCHGPKLSGGPATSPAWFDRAPAECGDCHGAPPPNHAPGSTQCNTCHPGTVDANRKIIVANGLHQNGKIDVEAAHPQGWSDPAQHGPAAKEDLASCRTCHGDDYAGGSTGVSCNDCHGGTGWQTDCTFCHGTPSRTVAWKAAPPEGTHGELLASQRAVGAHEQHLAGGGVGPQVACGECHAAVTTLAHVDGTPQVVFGAAASSGGRTPSWNTGNLTCSNTACHLSAQPVWTGGASQAGCGTCHGIPPAGHATGACGTCHTGYTASTVNAALHMNGTVDSTGGHAPGWAAKEQHGYYANANGLASCKTCHGATLTGANGVQGCATCHAAVSAAWATDCYFCHGTAGGQISPPVDTQGRTARTNASVGAHAKHAAPAMSPAIGCGVCHASRGSVITDAGHMDGGGMAEVALTGLGAGTYTHVSATDGTCTTYCHGAFTGGKNATASWTSTVAMTCTSCHGAPPPVPHVQRTDCGTCHPGYTATTVNASTHVNGTINTVTLACSTCHGKSGQAATAAAPLNAAPPVDATGASSSVRVGAHQKHLTGGTFGSGLACATCHATVGAYVQKHANGTREVGFTGAPNTNLAKGTYTPGAAGATASCSATWCHGNFTGGSNATVTWTGGAMTCGSCHAIPPAGHSTSSCDTCHTGYTATTVNLALHMDGKVDATGGHAAGWAAKEQHGYSANANGLSSCKTCHGTDLTDCTTCHTTNGHAGWRTECTFCHGTPGGLASPPVDTAGLSLRTNVSVGAHAKHAATTLTNTAIGCTACHATRGDVVTDAAHMDGGPAEVQLTGMSNGTYTRTSDTAATCATYCHGTFTGGNNQQVSWTSTTALTCTSCHGAPPPAPHMQRTDCGTCHTGYSNTTANAATHINGTVDHVAMTCTTCHGKAGQTATAAAPLNAAPPVDTAGLSSSVRVGAHQKHLTGGSYANAFACTTCHQGVGSYTMSHPNATRDVGFGGAANANLQIGTFTPGVAGATGTCTAFCHGNFSGGKNPTVNWSGAAMACTTCHNSTPTTGEHTRHINRSYNSIRIGCANCHGAGYTISGTVGTGVSLATHVDGVKTIVTSPTAANSIRTWNPTTRTCTVSCHGSETW